MNVSGGFVHRPVMLDEILSVFESLDRGVFLDATVGGAGHATAVALSHPGLSIVGLDRDPDALEASRLRCVSELGDAAGRVTLRHARFDDLGAVLDGLGIESLAGALFDLGVSSPQLDRADRGFSYRHDALLDMRMDPTSGTTAAEIVNFYDENELATMLRENADERFARRIARAIVEHRPLQTSAQLVGVVTAAIPAAARRRGGHPAKRTFQALRIEVNQELEILGPALRSAIDRLAPGARLAVLSYHSGEDRIVKSVFREAETGGCTCPPGLPCGCGRTASVRRVRAARSAGTEEVAANPRSRSVRLRVVERLAPDGSGC